MPDEFALRDPLNESPRSRAALEALGFQRERNTWESGACKPIGHLCPPMPTEQERRDLSLMPRGYRAYCARREAEYVRSGQTRQVQIEYIYTGSKAREFHDKFVR